MIFCRLSYCIRADFKSAVLLSFSCHVLFHTFALECHDLLQIGIP